MTEPADPGSAFRHRAPNRDAAPAWVLPLVVRIERASPPVRTDALEAAGRAVLALLADPRSQGGRCPGERDGEQGDWDGECAGAWADAVRSWEAGRIRKVVRRARGAQWRRASGLDGITVEHRTAQVRVFPPVPVDGWPPELARLQVGGTDLADPAPPPAPAPATAVVWLAPDLEMTAGKAMAQVGHAVQLAWWELGPVSRARWRDSGFELAVRTAAAPRWARLLASDLPFVRDAGFTEVAPGSCTAVAELP
jgi:peptidyl-tRNA hydrolase